MQPALADRVHRWTLPASAATTGVCRAATRSLPWWVPPARGTPKSSEKVVLPTTGNTIRAGGAEVATVARDRCTAASATRPRAAAQRRIRAVVRGKRILGRARKRLQATRVCGAEAPPARRAALRPGLGGEAASRGEAVSEVLVRPKARSRGLVRVDLVHDSVPAAARD